MHSGEREILGVESKKRRVEAAETELETEESIDPDAYKIFTENLENRGISKDSAVWKMLFDEIAMDRLRERDPTSWMREVRRRELAQADRERAEAGDGGGELGGEDGTGEGRPVRGPTQPYVPTEKERQEHNRTHYPHRTWCECCMAGRAVAGAHARSRDESDPNAGEFHFDLLLPQG